MKKIGIYLHIPFCKQKCYYCDFVSFAKQEDFHKNYINALKEEIKSFLDNNQYEISTIYIGGGTPSFIDEKYIEEILNLIPKENAKEITIEINPGTATLDKLNTYKKIGINRLSVGLQACQNGLLKEIGRIHNFEDFLYTYKMAQQVGFDNINVDLMIGLPNQNIKDIKESLEKVIELQPNHISVYSLIVEENTPISNSIENGKLTLPSEELERNMYWYVKDFLELNAYKHYEISNFAKQGFESKHNMDCWNQEEYIGLGLSAHSYLDDIRFANTNNLKEYIDNYNNKNFEKNKIIQETQNKYSKEQEYMLLGLRKIDGISISNFKNKFGENPIIIFKEQLKELVESSLITIDLDNIKLTNKGLDLANIVWEQFV